MIGSVQINGRKTRSKRRGELPLRRRLRGV